MVLVIIFYVLAGFYATGMLGGLASFLMLFVYLGAAFLAGFVLIMVTAWASIYTVKAITYLWKRCNGPATPPPEEDTVSTTWRTSLEKRPKA